ncbi:hypothetical protein AUC61_00495 [Pseudomonas sp. S25]|uniref:SCP domain-containing protein n=1 Tax=Pseudomonas maioricensis TaxID=1766623 RepID=A0ABS9ZBT9_9PSED|nr:CAP domain-containing protein [Pseudomonas sp. S25]MCI8208000.1 hypothetical protein [Pseudomonas sp. S25]
MRLTSRFTSLCFIALLPLLASQAHASEAQQLVSAINDYRAQPSRCEGRAVRGLSPLELRQDLTLPIGFAGDMRNTLKASGYRAVAVRSIRLVGAQDARGAFAMLQSRYCGALLDNQYADIGITQSGRDWRLVLAKPLLDGHLGDQQSAGKTLLAQVNAARAKPRMCGSQPYAAARPLTWNTTLENAALRHSQSMASGGYFSHQDPNGDIAKDRARAAGYDGRQVGENIASGQGSPEKAMQGWLASPGHCANLMNPMFTQMGAAYGTNPNSKAGVYWTMMFGAP